MTLEALDVLGVLEAFGVFEAFGEFAVFDLFGIFGVFAISGVFAVFGVSGGVDAFDTSDGPLGVVDAEETPAAREVVGSVASDELVSSVEASYVL